MRDPKRIEPIVILVKKLWEQYPDLRFFQLIELVKNRLGQDAFYLEDRYVHDALKKIISEK